MQEKKVKDSASESEEGGFNVPEQPGSYRYIDARNSNWQAILDRLEDKLEIPDKSEVSPLCKPLTPHTLYETPAERFESEMLGEGAGDPRNDPEYRKDVEEKLRVSNLLLNTRFMLGLTLFTGYSSTEIGGHIIHREEKAFHQALKGKLSPEHHPRTPPAMYAIEKYHRFREGEVTATPIDPRPVNLEQTIEYSTSESYNLPEGEVNSLMRKYDELDNLIGEEVEALRGNKLIDCKRVDPIAFAEEWQTPFEELPLHDSDFQVLSEIYNGYADRMAQRYHAAIEPKTEFTDVLLRFS